MKSSLHILKYFQSAFFLVILALNGITVQAKCPIENYTIEGSIQDNGGDLIVGSRVIVFIDEVDSSESEDLTSSFGEFQVTALYDSFIRTSIFGDKCGRAPKSIELIILKKGFSTEKKRITTKDFDVIDVGMNKKLIKLGTITIGPRRCSDEQPMYKSDDC